MALGSQMLARGNGRSYSSGRRRRRSRPKRLLALIAVAVVAWFGWSLVFSGGSEQTDAPSNVNPDAVANNDEAEDRAEALDRERAVAAASGFESVAAGLRSSTGVEREPFSPTQPRDLTGASDSSDNSSESTAAAEPPSPEPDRTTAGTDDTPDTEPEPEPEPAVAAAERDTRDEPNRSRSTSRTSRSNNPAVAHMQEGQALYEDGDLVDARAVLNTALTSGQLSSTQEQDVRDLMAQINKTLVFSPKIEKDDPLADAYEIQSGDVLSKVTREYNVPWQMIAHVNGDLDPRRIRVGQRIKMIKGPFHVVVHKRAYRLDLFLGDMYIRSYDVGLGEHDMTPTGEFIVRSGKLEDPEWTNPRTGERYLPDDPENPLGGYWIGIRGTTPETEVHTGYGIHGTIEPDSIGTDASMGCIRLLPRDARELYTMLTEEQSRVLVVE